MSEFYIRMNIRDFTQLVKSWAGDKQIKYEIQNDDEKTFTFYTIEDFQKAIGLMDSIKSITAVIGPYHIHEKFKLTKNSLKYSSIGGNDLENLEREQKLKQSLKGFDRSLFDWTETSIFGKIVFSIGFIIISFFLFAINNRENLNNIVVLVCADSILIISFIIMFFTCRYSYKKIS